MVSLHSTHPIYYLRTTHLDDRLQAMLSPIISAYRPHDPIPNKEELPPKITQTSIKLSDLSNTDLLWLHPLKIPINRGFYTKKRLKRPF